MREHRGGGGRMSGLHERWAAALDDLEHQLDRHRAVLDGHDEPEEPGGWQPPPELGPVPVHLRSRARELVTALDEVTDRADDRREEVADELRELSRRRGAVTAYADAR